MYTGESVGYIFSTMFSILHSRFPACSPLSPQETKALGDAWYPIMNEYLGDKGSKWILPIVVTAPIVIVRFSEYARVKKEEELKEEILRDMPQEKFEPEPPKDEKKKDKWSDRL